MGRHVRLAVAILLFALAAYAQTPSATITFTYDFPGSQPDHYVIMVSGDDRGHYESDGKLSALAESSDAYQFDFGVTPEFRSHLFELAKRAHYFSGEIDSKKKG